MFSGCAKLGLLFVITAIIAGCGGEPQTKFTPSDASATTGQTTQFTFETDPIGGLPKGAQVFSGTWAIRSEADAPSKSHALCQTGNATFPALSLSDTVYGNVAVSVQFKPISGDTDQAAGIIFRIQDKDNYYILRANALENNVNFYKYASGQRSSIKEASAKVASRQWQEMRIEVVGNRMQGFLNGKLVNQATDDSYKVGKVGLWTKADSVTCFDSVQVTAR